MIHITMYPLRKPQQFFGQDCQIEKLAHSAIEHARLETENSILRSECARWKLQAQSSMAGQEEIALRLAELMEREQAMVTEIAQHEAIDNLRIAQLDRADNIQTTQRMRIDELTRDRDAANEEIIDRDATICRLDDDLRTLRGPSALDYMRAEMECDE